jgi:hypothetical protein
MDGLYDRTTESDVMKSTFTAVLWFYDATKSWRSGEGKFWKRYAAT